MLDPKREVFIHIDELSEIISLLENISKKEKNCNSLFKEYDKLSLEEVKMFENVSENIDGIANKISKLTL